MRFCRFLYNYSQCVSGIFKIAKTTRAITHRYNISNNEPNLSTDHGEFLAQNIRCVWNFPFNWWSCQLCAVAKCYLIVISQWRLLKCLNYTENFDSQNFTRARKLRKNEEIIAPGLSWIQFLYTTAVAETRMALLLNVAHDRVANGPCIFVTLPSPKPRIGRWWPEKLKS